MWRKNREHTPFFHSLSKRKQTMASKKIKKTNLSPFSFVLQTVLLWYESLAPTNFSASSITGGRRKPTTAEGFVASWLFVVCCRKLVVSLRLSILGIPWSRSDGGGGCFFPGSDSRLWSSFYTHPARVLSWIRRSKGVSHLEVLEVLQFVYPILVFSLEKVIRTLYFLFLNLFRSLLGRLWTFTADKRLFTVVSSLEYNMCGFMLAGSCCCEFSIWLGLEVSLIWSKWIHDLVMESLILVFAVSLSMYSQSSSPCFNIRISCYNMKQTAATMFHSMYIFPRLVNACGGLGCTKRHWLQPSFWICSFVFCRGS